MSTLKEDVITTLLSNNKSVLLIHSFLAEHHIKYTLYMQMQKSLPSQEGKLIFKVILPWVTYQQFDGSENFIHLLSTVSPN